MDTFWYFLRFHELIQGAVIVLFLKRIFKSYMLALISLSISIVANIIFAYLNYLNVDSDEMSFMTFIGYLDYQQILILIIPFYLGVFSTIINLAIVKYYRSTRGDNLFGGA